ncbi:MAG: hypothetical protein K9L70_02685 [Thiohalocapsa sp.]|nr:hypothetical protein [Thiohalocapsa sp.]MCF7988994.1 hypothetical protein [Thiohalocapsa sp.]
MKNLVHLSPKAVPAAVVTAGALLSILAAVFPHFDSAYRLVALPMFSGLAGYGFYGVLAGLWNSEAVRRAGIRMLALHLAAVLMLRLFFSESSAIGLLSLLPVLLALGLLKLWPEALRVSDPVNHGDNR